LAFVSGMAALHKMVYFAILAILIPISSS